MKRSLLIRWLLLLIITLPSFSGCGGARSSRSDDKVTGLPREYQRLLRGHEVTEWRSLCAQALEQQSQGRYTEASRLFQLALLLNIEKYNGRVFEPGEDAALVSARGQALLDVMAVLADKLYDYPEFTRFHEAVAGSLSPHFQNHARRFLSAGHWSTHNLAAAHEVWDAMGYVESWRIIGPFDNERGGGFQTAYPPEQELRFDAEYPGKERAVRWREFPVRPNFGAINLSAVLRPAEEALAYAVTYVSVPEPADAAIQWAADESAKIWLNDALVFEQDIHRPAPHGDYDAIPIRLAAGWNKLLVKCGTQTGYWGFQARLTDLSGQPLECTVSIATPGITGDMQTPVYTAADIDAMRALVVAPDAGAVYRTRFLERNPGAMDLYLGATFLAANHGFDYSEHPDKALIQKAIELEPDNSAFHLVLAETSRVHAEVAAQQEHNDYRRALEAAVRLSPRNAEAYLGLAMHYRHNLGNLALALEHVDHALAVNPDFIDAQVEKAGILADKDFNVESQRLAEAIVDRNPDHVGALRFLIQSQWSRGEINACLASIRHALTVDSSLNEIRHWLVNLLATRGEVDEALEGHLDILSYNPYDVESYVYRAGILASRDQFDLAAAEYEQALRVRPEDAGFLNGAAQNHHALGDLAKALDLWERSLEIEPTNTELRDYLEFLKREEVNLAALFPEDSAAVIRQAPDLEELRRRFPNEHYVYLLAKQVSRINDDGTASYMTHEWIRILSEAGMEEFDTYRCSLWGDSKCRVAKVFKADGAVVEARTGQGASVDLPQLAIGDIIEVQFTADEREKSIFGDYFGESYYFNSMVPVLRSRYQLVAPPDRKLYFHFLNMPAAEPVVTAIDGQNLVVHGWELTDLPKHKQEPNRPSATETSPILQVSTYESWDAFARWYWNLIRKQFEMTPEMQTLIAGLTRNAATDRDKVRAIYNWVVANITYNSAWEFGVHGYKPYNAATIFQRKRGDCKDKAILTVAMLRSIGINAYPVLITLVDSSARGREDLTLPLVNHFNHCISVVPGMADNGGDLYLDGTATYSAMDCFPEFDQGATVLIVKEDGGHVARIPLNGHERDRQEIEATVTLDDAGNARFSQTLLVLGSPSYVFRSVFETAEAKTQVMENWYGRNYASAKMLGEPICSDLSNLNIPVSMQFDMQLQPYATPGDGGVLRFKANEAPLRYMLRFKGYESESWATVLAGTEDRECDVILPTPWSFDAKTEYRLPAGWMVKSLPASVARDEEFGAFAIRYESADGVIRVHKSLASKTTRVPVEDYARFREFCLELDKAEQEWIEIHKP